MLDEFHDLVTENTLFRGRCANVATIPARPGDRVQPGRTEPAGLGRSL